MKHHLSYNALKGANGLGTLKFQEQMKGVTMQILVDSGNNDSLFNHELLIYLTTN